MTMRMPTNGYRRLLLRTGILTCVTAGLGLGVVGCESLRSATDDAYSVGLVGTGSASDGGGTGGRDGGSNEGDGGTGGSIAYDGGNDWSCLGQPIAAPMTYPMVTYTANVQDWVTGGPLGPDLTICVCNPSDSPTDSGLPCSNPLGPTKCTYPNMTNPTTNIPITLPGQTNFYIAFLTDSTVPDALYFNPTPMHTLVESQPPIRLITVDVVESIATSFNITLNPTLAIVQLRVFDCNGQLAAGIYCMITPSSSGFIPYVYRMGSPTPLFASTDDSGQFGFVNVSPHDVSVAAYLPGAARTDQELMQIATGAMPVPAEDKMIGTITFDAQPGWATLGDIRPYAP